MSRHLMGFALAALAGAVLTLAIRSALHHPYQPVPTDPAPAAVPSARQAGADTVIAKHAECHGGADRRHGTAS